MPAPKKLVQEILEGLLAAALLVEVEASGLAPEGLAEGLEGVAASPEVLGRVAVGSCLKMSVIDYTQFGSSCSVRGSFKLGGSGSDGNGYASIMGFVCMASSMSLRQFSRVGSGLSVMGSKPAHPVGIIPSDQTGPPRGGFFLSGGYAIKGGGNITAHFGSFKNGNKNAHIPAF